MLPRKHRLQRRKDFSKVYKTGKTLNAGLFRIKTKNNDVSDTRIGVVVSNKTVRKAVDRSKIKRKIRAAVQELLPELIQGKDIVILANTDINQATYHDMLIELQASFERIHFLKENNEKQ